MKIVLHIGTERTGSTSLQTSLKNATSILRDCGVCYLTDGGINSAALAYSFSSRPEFDFAERYGISGQAIQNFRDNTIHYFSQFLQTAISDANIKTLVLSSEHFSSRVTKPKDIASLAKYLKQYSPLVEVVLFQRDAKSFIRSLYTIALLDGHDISYQQFWRTIRKDERYFPPDLIIKRWEQAFDTRVNVIDYDKVLISSNPQQVFLEAIGINSRETPNYYLNYSSGTIKLRTLQIVNSLFPNYRSWSDCKKRSLTGDIIRRFLRSI